MSAAEQDQEPETRQHRLRRYEHYVEWALLAAVVVVCALVGLPQVVDSLRDGTVDLATVFYPVLLVAFAALAWFRRSDS